MLPEPISAFLQTLWDSGLRLSHSVRTPEECAEIHDQNIELNVSLLDQRFLAGDRALYAKFAERLPRFLHAQRDPLMRNLTRLTRERHQKYQNTYYHLEPNIKDTPGGLRDYQLVRWLAQHSRRGSPADRTRVSLPGAPALLSALPLRPRQQRAHFRCPGTGRRILRGARRGASGCAIIFATRATSIARRCANWNRAKRRTVRCSRNSRTGARAFRTPISAWRANASTCARRMRLEADPELALRLFQFVARHGIRPSTETEQRLAAALPRLEEWFATPRPVWPALKEILSLPYAAEAVRGMHDTGVLRAVFPEMAQIECLVMRDFYHRYTVDEHTLVTLQVLAGLRGTREPAVKRYTDLLSEMEDPALLLCALLFHDVGKGHARTAAHAEASVRAAEPALERIGMPRPERDLVDFLIRRHLEMSAVMNSRDLQDPATARHMAAARGNRRAPQGAHPDDLRGYQRRESHRHDALARRSAVAALSARLTTS